MKRTALALTLISALMFLAVVGAIFVNLAEANGFPSPEFDFPREPITTPPTIVVHSPVQNQNYNSTDVWLNFTVIKPEAWVQPSGFYGASDGKGNKEYDILGNVTSVYYVVDGGEHVNISVLDAPSFHDFHSKPLTLSFSISFTVAKGGHNVKVGFEADSYYLHMTGSWNGYLSSVAVNGTSELVSFTVLQETQPELDTKSFPTVFSHSCFWSLISCCWHKSSGLLQETQTPKHSLFHYFQQQLTITEILKLSVSRLVNFITVQIGTFALAVFE